MMREIRVSLCAIGLLGTPPMLAEAQVVHHPVAVRGIVTGEIVDATTGAILVGTEVALRPLPEGAIGLVRVRDSAVLQPSALQQVRRTVTDDEGVYRFPMLPDGRFEINVRRMGYRPATLVIDLSDAASLSMSVGLTVIPIRLEPSSPPRRRNRRSSVCDCRNRPRIPHGCTPSGDDNARISHRTSTA